MKVDGWRVCGPSYIVLLQWYGPYGVLDGYGRYMRARAMDLQVMCALLDVICGCLLDGGERGRRG